MITTMPSPRPDQFESHITVECATERLDELGDWASARGLDFLHIVLARGRMASQPMVTLTGTGSLAGHRRTVAAAAEALQAAGYRPVRVKTEAAPWNTGVPADDAQAAALPADTYFEHHLKLRLGPAADRERITAVARAHGAHLSWNARRPAGEDGEDGEQRFLTQRCHRVGLPTAGRRLAGLLADLARIPRPGGFEIRSVEREFVLHDSDITVDDGWLDTQPQQEGGR
ncbi:hypothetical protein ACFYNO_31510 [Kitasatospora sp. NPDC006697]|uniref:hypothetical protein n=1 Tax=Kitasatospora sp. NPDC006697 TaxID=3364020 RepID=UPI0036CF3040